MHIASWVGWMTAWLALAAPALAADLVLQPAQVAPGIYAVVGDLGAQTVGNDGLNANLGFVVTDDGVLVVNTGPSARVARALHAAIKKVSDKPVKWVVNVNSQNHYWHGNDFFKSIGARIVAHKEADRLMRDVGAQQLDNNKALLKGKAKGTALAYPDELVEERRELKLGGTTVQLLHFGPAHTPGDLVVWLPQRSVAFTGDIVYTERLLAVLPMSNSGNWIAAFDKLAALKPKTIVPGHGRPTAMKRADKHTRAYLASIRAQAQRVLDAGGTLDEAVDQVDQSRFRTLVNFTQLARRNVHQVYLELERDAF